MLARTTCFIALSTLGVATLGSTFVATPHAAAQDDRARARDAFRRGVARYDAADYDGALESFREAYRIAPHPTVRVNMANCYERLGRPDEAVFNYERFLAEAGADVPAERRTAVETALAALRARSGELALSVSPEGAMMSLDGGDPVPVPSEPMQLTAGHHAIDISRDGFVTRHRELDLPGGTRTTVSIDLVPVQPATPPPADVAQPTPVAQPVVSPTPVPLVDSAEVETESGGSGLRFTTPVLIAGGSTIALAVAATITGVLAVSADGEFDDAVAEVQNPETSAEARESARLRGIDAADRANTLAGLTDVLVGCAVVGAGVTVVLFLTQPRASAERRARGVRHLVAAPTTDGHGAGFALRGSF